MVRIRATIYCILCCIASFPFDGCSTYLDRDGKVIALNRLRDMAKCEEVKLVIRELLSLLQDRLI